MLGQGCPLRVQEYDGSAVYLRIYKEGLIDRHTGRYKWVREISWLKLKIPRWHRVCQRCVAAVKRE